MSKPEPVTIKLPGSQTEIKVHTGLFINNEFVASANSEEKLTCVPQS